MRLSRTLMAGAVATAILFSAAVPAFAADSSSSAGRKKEMKIMSVDGACMASAVTARDTAISSALGTVVTALQTRGTALSAAWKLTDAAARKAAIKAANDAFKGSWKTFNASRKNAWSTYKTAAKACHATGAEVESANEDAGSM